MLAYSDVHVESMWMSRRYGLYRMLFFLTVKNTLGITDTELCSDFHNALWVYIVLLRFPCASKTIVFPGNFKSNQKRKKKCRFPILIQILTAFLSWLKLLKHFFVLLLKISGKRQQGVLWRRDVFLILKSCSTHFPRTHEMQVVSEERSIKITLMFSD